jgi:hypothetical protein
MRVNVTASWATFLRVVARRAGAVELLDVLQTARLLDKRPISIHNMHIFHTFPVIRRTGFPRGCGSSEAGFGARVTDSCALPNGAVQVRGCMRRSPLVVWGGGALREAEVNLQR